MFDGTTKKVQDIEVGDLLIGPDSKPRIVKSLARGREKMYKVTPVKGESFGCNESHILSFKTSGWRVKSYGSGKNRKEIRDSGSVVNMSVRDYLKLPNYRKSCLKLWRPECIDFTLGNKEMVIDPYFLGIWLGDGSKNTVQITSIDKEIINYCELIAGKYNLFLRKSNKISYHLSTGNVGGHGQNTLYNEFKKLNLFHNKHIPHEYLTSSKQQRLELLAGLIDSDGYSHHNHIEITQKIKVLADNIAFLCRSLGFATYIREIKKGCWYKGEYKQGVYHKISISGNGLDSIPVKLERKKTPPRKQIKDALVTGFSLEDLGEGDYYGFTLEGPDSLFLLGDFTVTHNTQAAVARVLSLVLTHPGSEGIVAGYDRKRLQKSTWKEWMKRLSIGSGKFNHPLVVQTPNQTNGYELVLKAQNPKTGEIGLSRVWFCYLKDWSSIMGITADIAHFEEAQQIDSEDAFMEAIRRLRGTAIKRKQVILTTNPEEEFGWLYNTFNLRQDEPKYEGGRLPRGNPCRCQFCQACLNKRLGEFPYVDEFGEVCTDKGSVCPECGVPKDNQCKGNQEFYRVVFARSDHNIHIASTFAQNVISTSDSERGQMYAEGLIVQRRSGKVYYPFTMKNVLAGEDEQRFNPDKDLIWGLDFNKTPQCSVVIQEDNDKATQIDELVLWGPNPDDFSGANAEDVGFEFVRRYAGFQKTVHIYGDPAGLYGAVGKERTKFQTLIDILNANGFKVICHTKKIKGELRIPIKERVDNVNHMLRENTEEATIRFFINKSCRYTIESLQKSFWTEDGKDIDDKCDTNAKGARDKNQTIHMTHPTDALGYYIYKRFNLLRFKSGVNAMLIPGEVGMTQDGDKITKTDLSKENKKKEEEKDPSWTPKPLNHILDTRGFSMNNNLWERLKYEKEEQERRDNENTR